MKITYKLAAALAGVSVLLSSCVVADGGYGSFGVAASGNGYSASVAWSNASYDANGFPIFGYSYGRPVYGYTAAGAAVFTFAALTALCFVPHWGPAPWYRGSWHYPPRIHRVATPPHYPHGHMPHIRPQGGMNAPIHHARPSSPLRPNSRPQGPAWAGHPQHAVNKPTVNRPVNRPNMAPHKPAGFNGGNMGAVHKPVHQNNMPTARPGGTVGHIRNGQGAQVPHPSVQQHRPNVPHTAMPHASMPNRASGSGVTNASGAARPTLHRGGIPGASGSHHNGHRR